MMRPSRDLSRPRTGGRFALDTHYDPEAFGRFSEGIARFLGTGRYLVAQTVLVVVWIFINVAVVAWRFDPYPFILLNLAFSTQAAYAAPLILLAQNRQDERDRAQSEIDREIYARTKSDTDYLAREVAAINRQLEDVATIDDLARAVDELRQVVESLRGDLRPDATDAAPA